MKESNRARIIEFFKTEGVPVVLNETHVASLFPLRDRFKIANQFESTLNLWIPDFMLSPLNIAVRAICLLLSSVLIYLTIEGIIFFAILQIPNAIWGVLAFDILFPAGFLIVFYPTLIKRSGFGQFKRFEDFVKEVDLINFRKRSDFMNLVDQ